MTRETVIPTPSLDTGGDGAYPRTMRAAGLVFLLSACKLHGYNPEFAEDMAVDDGTPGPTTDDPLDETFAPAVVCPVVGEARLNVADRMFPIICGCEEEPWSGEDDSVVCTVPAGTRVVWTFVGSEDHTVTSDAIHLDSGLRGAGTTVRHTYDKAGEYDYECTEHSEMRGYVISVL